MSFGRGGLRQNAGRPKGSKSKTTLGLKRPPLSPIKLTEVDVADAKARAKAILEQVELPLLKAVMESDDLRLRVEVWKILKLYGDGSPPKDPVKVDLSVSNFERVVRELEEQEKEREKQKLIAGSLTVEVLPAEFKA